MIKSLTPDVIADADILDIKMLGSEETLDWDKTSEGLKILCGVGHLDVVGE